MLHQLQLISNEFQRDAATPRDMKCNMANVILYILSFMTKLQCRSYRE